MRCLKCNSANVAIVPEGAYGYAYCQDCGYNWDATDPMEARRRLTPEYQEEVRRQREEAERRCAEEAKLKDREDKLKEVERAAEVERRVKREHIGHLVVHILLLLLGLAGVGCILVSVLASLHLFNPPHCTDGEVASGLALGGFLLLVWWIAYSVHKEDHY